MIFVCFGTNEKLHSRLIRFITKSEWSHVWIEYPSEVWGGVWAAHSSEEGVVKVPAERVHKAYPKHMFYSCDIDLSGGFFWARNRISAKYDYGVIWNAILYFLYSFLFADFLRKLVYRNASRFTCSEFVGNILKYAGVFPDIDPELMTPGDIERFVRKSGKFQYWMTHGGDNETTK